MSKSDNNTFVISLADRKSNQFSPQICNLICLPSIVIIRAPNSTPIVRSWTGWKRLSVNCNSKHDLPTPITNPRRRRKEKLLASYQNRGKQHAWEDERWDEQTMINGSIDNFWLRLTANQSLNDFLSLKLNPTRRSCKEKSAVDEKKQSGWWRHSRVIQLSGQAPHSTAIRAVIDDSSAQCGV